VSVRIGLMGFGRIGRNVFRIAYPRDDIEIVAIDDIADPKALAYLLRFDTVHGKFEDPVTIKGENLYVAGRQIKMLQYREPGEVPWGDFGVDVVVEATGQYRYRAQLEKHLERGAAKVILCVPARDEIDAMIVMGVNDHELKPEHRIVSNASCTANCLAPIAKVLNDAFGIEKAFMTTVHAYTNDQRLADVPHQELRRSRAAAENIIPTSTWSPRAVERMIPELEGRIGGIAMNVPVPDGSTVDMVSLLKREAGIEEVNEAVREAAAGSGFKGIIEYTEEPIVSSDVIGNPHSSIFDSLATAAIGGNMVKTLSWYDNGWGYASRVVDLIGRLFPEGAGPEAQA